MFRIILPVVIITFVAHRGYYTNKNKVSASDTLKMREESLPSKLAAIYSAAGFLATLAYVINPSWVSWAAISLPLGLRWTGVGMALSGFMLLQWAQNTLGKNWSDTPRMMKAQALVTSGPYQFIRHPIYTAFILILGSTLFISANWLIGLSWTGMAALEIASRIGFEESLMLEYFGDQYRAYMKMTGRLWPRLTR